MGRDGDGKMSLGYEWLFHDSSPGEAESAEMPSNWDMYQVYHTSRSGRNRNTLCMWIKI